MQKMIEMKSAKHIKHIQVKISLEHNSKLIRWLSITIAALLTIIHDSIDWLMIDSWLTNAGSKTNLEPFMVDIRTSHYVMKHLHQMQHKLVEALVSSL